MTINSQLPVATIEAAAATLAAAASAMSDAELVRQEIIYKKVPESMSNPAVDSDKFRAGVFIFDTDTDGEKALVQIPSVRLDKIMVSGDGAGVLINTEDAEVIAFVDALVTAEYCNPFAYDLAVLIAAYRQSRV